MSNVLSLNGKVLDKKAALNVATRLLLDIQEGRIVSFVAIGIQGDDETLAYSASVVPGFTGLKAMGAAYWLLKAIGDGELFE